MRLSTQLLASLMICLSVNCAPADERPEANERTAPETQFSVWYWLNSVEKDQWAEDFENISRNGFTHVILCWGYDLSAFRLRTEDSLHALELCEKYDLGAYLLIWHPVHNTMLLEADPEHLHVDNQGHRRFSFNLYNRDWRNSQWRDYLHLLGRTYRESPALAGYVFDDSFFSGPVSDFDGEPGVEAGDFVSYSEYDESTFREWLREKYSSLDKLNEAWQTEFAEWADIRPPRKIENEEIWQDWVDARAQWLNEWAQDTMRFIREEDPDPNHIVYVEDIASKLGLEEFDTEYGPRPVTVVDTMGLRFGEVTGHFDRLGAYTAFGWEGEYQLDEALQNTRSVIEETRRQAGSVEQLVYTFWISDWFQVHDPGPVTQPSAEQIWAISEAALSEGVRHIDYYGYQIGDARMESEDEWKEYLPGRSGPYPISKQHEGDWLADRPDVTEKLGRLIREYLDSR